MTDTSKEAAWDALMNYQQADEDGIMVLVSRQAIHECKDERDALRDQLQAAKDEALEEGIEHACAVIDAFSEYDQNECCDGRECGCYGTSVHDHMKHQIRALKPTSAEGEGCQVCEGSGSVSTTDIDHNGEHIEASCPNCKETPNDRSD